MKADKLIASGLGTGFAPLAPGTAGSALGIVLFYLLNRLWISSGLTGEQALGVNLLVIAAVLFAGVWSVKKVHQSWPHDAPQIVIDEIVGVWIAALALPPDFWYYLYAFVFFRFFDIAKPLFIRKLDKTGSDWSVMLDDVLAGTYSLIVLQILLHFKLI